MDADRGLSNQGGCVTELLPTYVGVGRGRQTGDPRELFLGTREDVGVRLDRCGFDLPAPSLPVAREYRLQSPLRLFLVVNDRSDFDQIA